MKPEKEGTTVRPGGSVTVGVDEANQGFASGGFVTAKRPPAGPEKEKTAQGDEKDKRATSGQAPTTTQK